MNESDPRLEQLRRWLVQCGLPVTVDPDSLRPASSDASFRRYFRVDRTDIPGATLVVMDAPPPQEDVRPFLHAAQVLRRDGVTVPAVHAADTGQGLLLLDDFGSETLLERITTTPDDADRLMRDACGQLVALQQGSRPDTFAPYDRALQERELRLFDVWYLGRHHGLALTEAEQQTLFTVYEQILANTTSQPAVHVHRDWHSRNLMVLPAPAPAGHALGVIDFQDAVFGPVTYDLVSMLRDAYIAWDEEQQLDWAVRYWEVARRADIPVHADFGDFYRDMEWMGLQRHLKVLGIFARLAHRDGKTRYLGDMPRVTGYVLATARRYREFGPLLRLLQRLDEAPASGLADR